MDFWCGFIGGGNYGFKPMKSPYREHSRSWRGSRDGAPYEDSAPGLT